MLDLAAVAQGSRVLDVGCGSGEQTVIAARRVGETGHVPAIDIAAPMVAATEKNVAAAGLRNVSTRVCPVDALSADQLTRANIVGLQRQAMTHAKGENANV
jgi:ubiquinone/menaquinone biosynthesis C-methylase UbiE